MSGIIEDVNIFDSVSIRIASPDVIRSWSRGEVKKPETINYRTFKPEKDGLFCEKIFGPTKDWECNCGKYKRIKHKGIICDRCGVEVTQSKVRRERMGHIELAAPVSHIWFFKVMPSRIGTLLDLGLRELERVLYYEEYIVIDPKDTPLKKKELLTEEKFQEYQDRYGQKFVAKMGAEAVRDLLLEIDLDKLGESFRKELQSSKVEQVRNKAVKSLKIIEDFKKSGNKPEWMILEVIPVIPPDLRPLVPLDGGRFVTSDLNDLYRRVINRNNRLEKLIELKAPDVIIRNEKRMLQEAVDALFDNGRHGRPVLGSGNRPLKSLSDMLKGKQGRFRQNLLGKRVDYSGRSVIVIGPELKLHQCGLPKKMARELFEPFIVHKLRERGHVHTIKSAKKMVEKEKMEIWDILDEIIKEHPVLLNRAPTLHRLGIQAFEPVLIEGKAIRIHPLVCTAFNADFDGDQMAVHVPLSMEAQMESRLLMLSTNNIFSPSDGRPIAVPTQDIVLGLYYLTAEKKGDLGEGKVFADPDEVLAAYNDREVGLHARCRVRINSQLIDTTIGRVLFNQLLPEGLPFINERLTKKKIGEVIEDCYQKVGHHKVVQLLDALKAVGFEEATRAGISISIDDIRIPEDKPATLEDAKSEIKEVESQYKRGVITDGERYNKIIDVWTRATNRISVSVFEELDQFNPIFMMADSGARGSREQIRQLAGMRGLMAKPSGEIIAESPITANFREGLTVLEYFISTHGARKGLADTALKTADAGYLTRRLVDAAQEAIIMEEDCGTMNGILTSAIIEGDEVVVSLKERIVGRISLDNIVNIITDEVIVAANEIITNDKAAQIEDMGIETIRIRSVLTCESYYGVCGKCYGRNLGTGRMVEAGEAVGIIAAQSIGEPGTQLTMRTFHIGGTASSIVEQSFIKSEHEGVVKYHNLKTVQTKAKEIVVLNRNGQISVNSDTGRELERYTVPSGAVIGFPDNGKVAKGNTLAHWDPYTSPILTEAGGRVKFEDIKEGITMRQEVDESTGLTGRVIIEHRGEYHPQIIILGDKEEVLAFYTIPAGAHIVVKDNQMVDPGSLLAKTPRKITKTKDITAGLPRVAELFEARRPKDPAIISEIDGVVEFGEARRGQRRIVIKSPTGMKKEYFIPYGKHLNVYKNDRVTSGQALTEGPIVLQEILRISGEKKLQEYLVNEIQEVYRLQGVKINDKHIEVIVRQMLRKVKIEDPGDTDFLKGVLIDKSKFQEENERVLEKKKKPASATPVLLGITKASLNTESFISAASFQETTRVLTEAATSGKEDSLRGLKENVIMGHLIPAGTGFPTHRNIVSTIISPPVVKEEKNKVEEKDGVLV